MRDDLVTKADFRDFEARFEAKLDLKLEQKLEEKLEEKLAGLRIQVAQNSLDIIDLRTDMDRRFDTVITALDGIAGLVSNGRVEKAAAESTFRRHETKLEDHESRIGSVERKVEGIARGGVS